MSPAAPTPSGTLPELATIRAGSIWVAAIGSPSPRFPWKALSGSGASPKATRIPARDPPTALATAINPGKATPVVAAFLTRPSPPVSSLEHLPSRFSLPHVGSAHRTPDDPPRHVAH